MPLDPSEQRRLDENIGRLETRANQLFIASQQLSIKLNVLSERLKATESLNKALWAVVFAVGLASVLGFSAHMMTIGSLEVSMKANAKNLDSIQAEVKSLAAEFHEHERRSSILKPEAR